MSVFLLQIPTNLTVVIIQISKPNGCYGLGPIFPKSTTPRVFKIDIGEFTDFYPRETLDQKYFFEVILLNYN